ncbi:hypothetical protein LDO48_21245 [Pantoea agglomerans]|nr:hypothetical protein [Pantoea agglomerans]
MIAWSGVGFFVAVLISAAYLLCKWLLDIYYYDGFFVSHLWATGATLIVSALFLCGLCLGTSAGKMAGLPCTSNEKPANDGPRKNPQLLFYSRSLLADYSVSARLRDLYLRPDPITLHITDTGHTDAVSAKWKYHQYEGVHGEIKKIIKHYGCDLPGNCHRGYFSDGISR